jgi:hypothetical protein
MDAQELRDAYAALEPMGDQPPPRYTWERHRWEMRRHVAQDDIGSFLNWSTVTATMFAGETPYTRSELHALKAQPDWGQWHAAIEDLGVGQAPRMSEELSTNANMVHQAFHLMMWNKATLREIRDLETVTEFGGGYGAMALVASRLGFKGTWRMVDFPEMCLLQSYYLSQHELGCAVEFCGDVLPIAGAGLYVACYSLSETPLSERKGCVDLGAKSYLLAFQEHWDDVDNLDWVEWFALEDRDEVRWRIFPMARPGHWYAMGAV